MAPIGLKDKRIEELTKQLVKRFVSGELSKKNFPAAVQFAMSNFRYHKFLDVDSNKVEKTVKGLCEKFSIHGQEEKAKSLTELTEKFVNGLLFEESQITKSDGHYSLLKVLITLSNSPVNAIYEQPVTEEQETAKDTFNWTKYLLDGEEKYMIHYHDTYDEELWTDSEEDTDGDGDVGVDEDKNTILEHRQQHSEENIEGENIGGITELRDFLTGHLVETYWLPDEGCSAIEPSGSEMSLASQWALYSQETHPFGTLEATQRLHEIQLVRETIWMLSGVKKLYVYNFINERFGIRDEIEMTHITKTSLHKFLETFTETATLVVELRGFIRNANESIQLTKIPLTFQAFGFAILHYLQEFNEHLSDIEELIIKRKEAVTLSSLRHRITHYQKEILEIYNIYFHGIKNINKSENYEKVTCFLNAFYQSILLADGMGEYGRWKIKVLLQIFLKSLAPYVEFLDGCLTEAKLVDDSNEFCIERLPNISHQDPKIWTSALNIKGAANISCPSFLAPVLQEIALAAKSIILLETLGELAKNAHLRFQEQSLHAMFVRSVSTLSNTQSMAELFRVCLYPHIQEKYKKSCSSLIRLLKSEHMLLDHLAAVRSFFFLEAGDAMHHFYTDIFGKCSRRERWQDMSYLNSLFQEALLPVYSNLQERFTVGYSKPTKVYPDSLEGLELNYKAPWPVDLVIDAISQKKYNSVFLFLLHVKRAKWSLDDLRFTDLQEIMIVSESDKDQEGPLADREISQKHHHSQHRMHLLRFDLMQFVNGLHQYIMTRILHSKMEFEEALTNATDLDEIIKTHSLYIERVLERCLMTNKVEVMRVSILKVLRLAVKFNKLWTNTRQNRDDIISSIGEDLRKWRMFIVKFLTNQIKQGSYPHLETLASSLGPRKTITGS